MAHNFCSSKQSIWRFSHPGTEPWGAAIIFAGVRFEEPVPKPAAGVTLYPFTARYRIASTDLATDGFHVAPKAEGMWSEGYPPAATNLEACDCAVLLGIGFFRESNFLDHFLDALHWWSLSVVTPYPEYGDWLRSRVGLPDEDCGERWAGPVFGSTLVEHLRAFRSVNVATISEELTRDALRSRPLAPEALNALRP